MYEFIIVDGEAVSVNSARSIKAAQQIIQNSEGETGEEFIVYAIPASPLTRRIPPEWFQDAVATDMRMFRKGAK